MMKGQIKEAHATMKMLHLDPELFDKQFEGKSGKTKSGLSWLRDPAIYKPFLCGLVMFMFFQVNNLPFEEEYNWFKIFFREPLTPF